MKTKRLGRALSARKQETKRLTALTARRREQGLARFIESLQSGGEFRDGRAVWRPVG